MAKQTPQTSEAVPDQPAEANAPQTVPLRASELSYLTDFKKRHPGRVLGEVRTQRLLDPSTGTVREFKVRAVKTKRPRGRR